MYFTKPTGYLCNQHICTVNSQTHKKKLEGISVARMHINRNKKLIFAMFTGLLQKIRPGELCRIIKLRKFIQTKFSYL